MGIHYGHDSSVAIVKDGKYVANLSAERLTQVKKYSGVTRELSDYVLSQAGLTYEDVDYVVVTNYDCDDAIENHVFRIDMTIPDIMARANTHPKYRPMEEYPGILYEKKPVKTYLIDHHLAHAGSAYYLSNFENSIVMTVDACSSNDFSMNGSIAIGDGNKLTIEDFPGTMIAIGYNMFTALLELGPPVDKAGTTMGLASYGDIHPKVLKDIKKYVELSSAPGDAQDTFMGVWSDLTNSVVNFNKYAINDRRAYPTGRKIVADTKLGRDMAATIQYIFEQSILDSVKQRVLPYGYENLCLAGGSMLNCNANSLIKKQGWFKNIYHVPAQGDDGLALGSALYLAHHVLGEKRHKYTDRDVAYSGKKYKVSKLTNHKKIAKLIADGKIVAWFMGASEFGPRALGHRSLLADPRNFHNREILNFVVKGREWYRPFAPSVLEEEAPKWFSPGDPSPFMLYTQDVLQPEKVPAITHVDGSARIQTVNREMDEDYYKLIKEFFKITGVPMVLNTSLNGKGKPIVETEEQALELFKENDGIDILVLNGKIYEK